MSTDELLKQAIKGGSFELLSSIVSPTQKPKSACSSFPPALSACFAGGPRFALSRRIPLAAHTASLNCSFPNG
jgi:hypothetical protein